MQSGMGLFASELCCECIAALSGFLRRSIYISKEQRKEHDMYTGSSETQKYIAEAHRMRAEFIRAGFVKLFSKFKRKKAVEYKDHPARA